HPSLRITDRVGEEFKGQGGGEIAQSPLDGHDVRGRVKGRRSQGWRGLVVVGAVGRVEFNPQVPVGKDRVLAHCVTRADVYVDAVNLIKGDGVAGPGRRSAQRVVRPLQIDSVMVGDGGGTGGIRADFVALH